jgi:hypothetical protein
MRFFAIYRYYRSSGFPRAAALRRAYRLLVS